MRWGCFALFRDESLAARSSCLVDSGTLINNDTASEDEDDVLSRLDGNVVSVSARASISVDLSDLTHSTGEGERVSGPVSVDSDASREGLDGKLGVDESELLGDCTSLSGSLVDGKLGHTELELFTDVGDLETSTKIGKAKILGVSVVLRVRVENVVTPFILDIHVRPAPYLLDGPARRHVEDRTVSVGHDRLGNDSRRAHDDLLLLLLRGHSNKLLLRRGVGRGCGIHRSRNLRGRSGLRYSVRLRRLVTNLRGRAVSDRWRRLVADLRGWVARGRLVGRNGRLVRRGSVSVRMLLRNGRRRLV